MRQREKVQFILCARADNDQFCWLFHYYISGKLLIADTNNNAIRYLDLNEKDPVLRTLELKGVQPPSSKPKSLKRLRRRLSADTKVIKVDGSSSKAGYFYIAFSVPDGYHFSKVLFQPLFCKCLLSPVSFVIFTSIGVF